jgi:hypothetical protein
MKFIVIDLFCGAGGTTTGFSVVPQVKVVACVNHDANAISIDPFLSPLGPAIHHHSQPLYRGFFTI